MRTLGQFLAFLFLCGFVVHYLVWIVGVCGVLGLVWWGVRAVAASSKRMEEKRAADAEMAARADQQDAWMSVGDERGLYGDWTPAC